MEHGFLILPIANGPNLVDLDFLGTKPYRVIGIAQVTDLWHKCLDLGIDTRFAPKKITDTDCWLVLEIRRIIMDYQLNVGYNSSTYTLIFFHGFFMG